MIFSIPIMLFLASTLSAQETENKFLEVRLMYEENGHLIDGGITAGCFVLTGESCQNVFWWKDKSHGVRGSIVSNQVTNPQHELITSFSLVAQKNQTLLSGTTYSMSLTDSGLISNGYKITVKQPISLEQKVILDAGKLNDGRIIKLQVSIYHDQPTRFLTHESNWIELVTTHLVEGTVKSQHSGGRSLSRKPIKIETKFSMQLDNKSWQVVEYSADIIFSCSIDDMMAGKKCSVTFTRTYSIDTVHFALTEFSEDVLYTSTNIQQLKFAPGQILKLVFPPDTPSVRGFDFEDTLIITPPE